MALFAAAKQAARVATMRCHTACAANRPAIELLMRYARAAGADPARLQRRTSCLPRNVERM